MIARSPAWIVIAGAVLVQASGGIDLAAKVLAGIDQSARAIIDLRAVVPQISTIIKPPKPKKKTARKAK